MWGLRQDLLAQPHPQLYCCSKHFVIFGPHDGHITYRIYNICILYTCVITGNPRTEKTPVPMTCTGGVQKTYYVQEYTSCDCDLCPIRPETVHTMLAPTTNPVTTHAATAQTPALANVSGIRI